ncbi:hypothetical protein [Sphingosinicella sp. BN140058]|uniref:hypothetical protein n=1 Tax=Sphingosinicella sp. BN140058 TaxID=1892855 RepID=UPI0010125ECB|nr:hypothetical protein [Sphingosinicella sp. BN140058]QAY77423.1 hypothetical protein ETR14_13590 [Sphingosinicella sp. BN140058]
MSDSRSALLRAKKDIDVAKALAAPGRSIAAVRCTCSVLSDHHAPGALIQSMCNVFPVQDALASLPAYYSRPASRNGLMTQLFRRKNNDPANIAG